MVVVVVRFSSVTGLSVVVVVFRITSELSGGGVDEQAPIVMIIIRMTKQVINVFLFFIAVNPFCKLVVKKSVATSYSVADIMKLKSQPVSSIPVDYNVHAVRFHNPGSAETSPCIPVTV